MAELNSGADDVVRDAIRQVGAIGRVDLEVARAVPSQIVVLMSASGVAAACEVATELERVLFAGGCRASVGWAFYPAEGTDGLSLYRVASERLYARRIVRGEWRPTAASAGLVEEFVPRER